jgi:Ca-activated chloride channel family protein
MKNRNLSKTILATSMSSILLLALVPSMSNAYAVTTLELCIAIDRSGSIVQGDLDTILAGIEASFMDASVVSASVSQMVKLSVVSFSNIATLEIAPFTVMDDMDVTDFADDVGALGLTSGGQTNTQAAIDLCALQFDDPTIGVIDIVTDGVPTTGGDAQDAANIANAAGILVNALAIGSVDQDFLDDLVDGPPAGTVYQTPDVMGFESAFMKKLMAELEIPVGGVFFPIDTTALFVAGFMLNSVWIIPTVAATGITGVGLYLAHNRFTKGSDS